MPVGSVNISQVLFVLLTEIGFGTCSAFYR